MADEVIYFVSDTHLGDGTGADRFHYPNQLIALLNRINAEPGARLVLLGDFMELWAARLESVMVHYASVFRVVGELAASHPVTYVVGNHDCLPWYYFLGTQVGSIEITEVFTAARGTLVALHGHQYDRYNKVEELTDGKVKVPWTRNLLEVVGFLGRVGGEAASDALYNLGDRLEQTVLNKQSPGERGYPAGEREYEEGAHQWLRKGARHVVMGHTHHPLIRKFGRKSYINSGSWVSDQYPPTYVRYRGGRLELLHGETHEPYTPPK